jgi:hypothetical protein
MNSFPPKSEGALPSATPVSRGSGPTKQPSSRWWRVLWCAGIVYIAAIGIFAIEELKRRESTLELLKEREKDVAAALATLGGAAGPNAEKRRDELERQQATLRDLRTRLTALMLGGSVKSEGVAQSTVRQILCELTFVEKEHANCPEGTRGLDRDIAATIVLKRPAEKTASGDVFAVLMIVASIGGALVRLYLPGGSEENAFRTIMQAIGGGIVCYLAVAGGALSLAELGVKSLSSPGTASLLGLLSGMFATKVFQLLSDIVDSGIAKLGPSGSASATPKTVVNPPAE